MTGSTGTDAGGGSRPPISARLKRRLAHLASCAAAFACGPGARRRLALEAVRELARARGETRAGDARYARGLVRPDGLAAPLLEGDEALAAEIGAVVAAVAAAVPFRALCLEQALAVRRMLGRRGIPAIVHIGMTRAEADGEGKKRDAHAWVTAGDRVVSGHADLGRFTVVGRFS